MRLAGIIFDLDGTIADSVEMFYSFACEIAADLEVSLPDREQIFELIRTGRSTLNEEIFSSTPRGLILRAFDARGPDWLRRYHDDTNPVPGSIEALGTLRDLGFRLGIATSSGRELPFLRRWGVHDFFSAIIGREDTNRPKPAPEIILRCLEQMRCVKEDVIYVGDSPIDIQAGKAAGVGTVGVLSGASPRPVLAAEQPDAILLSIAELPNLLADWS